MSSLIFFSTCTGIRELTSFNSMSLCWQISLVKNDISKLLDGVEKYGIYLFCSFVCSPYSLVHSDTFSLFFLMMFSVAFSKFCLRFSVLRSELTGMYNDVLMLDRINGISWL